MELANKLCKLHRNLLPQIWLKRTNLSWSQGCNNEELPMPVHALPRKGGAAPRGQVLPGAVARLSQKAANFGLEVRHPDAEVRRQRGRAGQNAGGNGNQNQRVLHQILPRLFLMELANEL